MKINNNLRMVWKVQGLFHCETFGDITVHYRKGEAGKTWFRTDRFFTIGIDWYAATREGRNLGPYKTRRSAEDALVLYIIDMKNNRKPAVQVTRPSRDIWKSNNYI